MTQTAHVSREHHTTYIALGSNLGNRLHYLQAAATALAVTAGISMRTAEVYESDPVERTDQPDFLNTVVELTTYLKPLDLLATLQSIERNLGRERVVRFGPRTIDLDILLFDDEYICFQSLQVPHPRMWQRSFALVPLADLDPNRRGLGGRTIRDLAAEVHGGGIRHVGCLW